MTNFEAAIKLPFSDWKKLSIGALLYMIPFLSLITGFFAYGYGLRCAKSAAQGKFALPEWTDWGDLFIKGLIGFVISLIYYLPAIILSVIAFTSVVVAVGSSAIAEYTALSADPLALFSLLAGAGVIFFIAMALYLLAAYVLPMAMMFYVNKGSFGAAFQFKEIFKRAFTGKYFVGILVVVLYVIGISIVISLISALLQLTVVLPYILTGYLSIVLILTLMPIYGQLYAETSKSAPAARAAPKRASAKRSAKKKR